MIEEINLEIIWLFTITFFYIHLMGQIFNHQIKLLLNEIN
jgi:hypothetical protein